MKKFILTLYYLSFGLLFAQQSVLVWHDEEIADTTINGFVEREIPFYSKENKTFINELIKDVISERYQTLYRYTLTPQSDPIKFPLLYNDHLMLVSPFPPYDEYDSIRPHEIQIEDISKIRIYEKWTFNNWNIDQKDYKKTIIGWSFIFRNRISDMNTGTYQDMSYDFNVSFNSSAKLESYQFEPYLFINDSNHIKFIRENLNYWDKNVYRSKPQFTLLWDYDRPFATQQLISYDMYFPDTVRSDYESIFDEPLDMPESRLSMMNMLYADIINGKYVQYKMDYPTMEYLGNKSDFPEVLRDTVQLQFPYPPYDYVDTIVAFSLNPNEVAGIRFYEIKQKKYNIFSPSQASNRLVGFSFLYIQSDPAVVKEARTILCPYLFVADENWMPYLAEKLGLRLVNDKK